MITITQLLDQIRKDGGAIVASSDCTAIEQAWASKEGRFGVRSDGIGFIRRPQEWLDRTPNPFPDMADAAGSANLAAFGKEILEIVQKRVTDDAAGEEDCGWLDIALKHGLVEQVIYDPDKHGYTIDAEPGHTIYWWGERQSERTAAECDSRRH